MKINWGKWIKYFNRPLNLNQSQIYSVSLAMPLKKILGKGINNQIYIIHQDNSDGYFLKREWNEFNNYIYNNCFNDSKFLETSNNEILQKLKEVERFFLSFKKIFFSKFSDKDILNFFKKTVKILNKDIAVLWIGYIIGDIAEKKILDIIKKYNLPIEQTINIIGGIEKPNHVLQEKIDLMKIVVNNKNKKKKLHKHYLKYQYIPCYSSEVKPYNLSYFENRIKNISILKAKKNIKKIKEDFKNNKKQFKLLLENKSFVKKDRVYIEYYHEFCYLRDYRSHFRSLFMFYYKDLIQDIASRKNISLKDILSLSSQEIISLFKSKDNLKDIKNIIRSRNKNGCTYLFLNNKEEIINNKINILKEKKVSYFKLKGLQVSKGIAVGKVKIVLNPNSINKIKKNDILVTTMTRPDYTVAMEKAIAIVTEEGGMLCHAAIVSREIKKPCVVGVKNILNYLKDGDLVEVDANKGIIKLVKKK